MVYNFKLQWYTLFVKKDTIARPVCKPAVAIRGPPAPHAMSRARLGEGTLPYEGIGIIVGADDPVRPERENTYFVEGRKRV